MKFYILAAITVILFVAQAHAYTTHINAPAVLNGQDRGILTNVTLTVIPGNGRIVVNNGSTSVGSDTVQSAITAVGYAANYLNMNERKYNFIFIIGSNDSNVSGPSAGLAFTLLTISGLEQRPLYSNFTVTGTISPNGSVGPIGGIFDKVQAAKSIRSHFVLAPYVNNSTSEYLLYYLSQQAYNTPVIEVNNVSQALPYAFGEKNPTWLNLNITANYNPSQIPNASSICTACNGSQFRQITNFTFNYTENEINSINGTRFGNLKSQLLSQLQQYKQIASKGYYYTGADLAFIEGPTAFMFANYNASPARAAQVISSIATYCNSLNYTPNMTAANYELVVGGEARLAWAMTTISAAEAMLNASQTSDEVILSLQEAAPALSWCAATSEMYNISTTMGGSQVTTSGKIKSQVLSQLAAEKIAYGGGMLYVEAANHSAANGDYAAALYSLTYANVFYNSSQPTYNSIPSVVSHVLATTQGMWPTQFALQSAFYISQANMSRGTAQYDGYLSDAYSTAMLSSSLQSVNGELQNNFVEASPATGAIQSAISNQLGLISKQLSLITYILVIIIALILIIFVILLSIMLGSKARGKKR